MAIEPPMRSTMRLEMVRPTPMPSNLRVGPTVGLLEFEEDARLIFWRNADAGVAHGDDDVVRLRARFDDDGDAAGFGEFDRVADQVENHLAQPRRIADHARRQALVDIAADFQALGLGAGPQKLDRLLDKTGKRERPRREIEPAGFDLRQIEQFLDERHQGAAGGFHGFEISRLLGR